MKTKKMFQCEFEELPVVVEFAVNSMRRDRWMISAVIRRKDVACAAPAYVPCIR